MEKENNLNQIPLANLSDNELQMLEDLEGKINNQRGERIYLMALSRD